MAEKPSDGNRTTIIVAVMSLIVAVVAAAAGLAQLQPVQDFACHQESILCKRDHVLHLFKISYIQSTTIPNNIDPWKVLLNKVHPRSFILPTYNTECVSDSDFKVLFMNNAIKDKDNRTYTIELRDSKLIFDAKPIDWNKNENKKVNLSPNNALIFYLGSRYVELVRNMTLNVDVTVEDAFQQLSQYNANRAFILPKGSEEENVFCRLFYPSEGSFKFRFSFRDDVWDTDDPIVVPLTISTVQNNMSSNQ